MFLTYRYLEEKSLTHFSWKFHFYTPWKYQKIKVFLKLSGGIEMEHWLEMGKMCFAEKPSENSEYLQNKKTRHRRCFLWNVLVFFYFICFSVLIGIAYALFSSFVNPFSTNVGIGTRYRSGTSVENELNIIMRRNC